MPRKKKQPSVSSYTSEDEKSSSSDSEQQIPPEEHSAPDSFRIHKPGSKRKTLSLQNALSKYHTASKIKKFKLKETYLKNGFDFSGLFIFPKLKTAWPSASRNGH